MPGFVFLSRLKLNNMFPDWLLFKKVFGRKGASSGDNYILAKRLRDSCDDWSLNPFIQECPIKGVSNG